MVPEVIPWKEIDCLSMEENEIKEILVGVKELTLFRNFAEAFKVNQLFSTMQD